MKAGTVGCVIATGEACLNDEKKRQIGGSNAVSDSGDVGNTGNNALPARSFRETPPSAIVHATLDFYLGKIGLNQLLERNSSEYPLSLLQHIRIKGKTMANSSMLDEDSLKRIVLGAVIGGVITTFAGFSGFGWTFESTAKDMAKKSANEAVVSALAPNCADKFQHTADATKNRIELMKLSLSEQSSFIEQGGWATLPGGDTANKSAVAEACAKMLSAPK
jgi:hypothetical protein